jgi:NAD(P)H-flavin reductase
MALDAMLPEPFAVRHARRETHDIFTLELEPSAGAFRFAPGQFTMLYAFGAGEVPISISGDPAHPERLVHTIRAVGAVSRALARLRRGDALGVRGPFGSAWPLEAAHGDDVIVIAGGVGLAPLRPAIYRLLAERSRYGRIVLLYGARTPADILYARELERWRARFDLEVEVSVDRAEGGWRGNVGVVTSLLERVKFDPLDASAFLCGPEVMMRFAAVELERRGVAHERIHVSLERNMKCAVGHCGRCQFGPHFICRDGPVFRYDRVRALMAKREV